MKKAPKKTPVKPRLKPTVKPPKKLPAPTWTKQWLEIGEVAEGWEWTIQDLLHLGGQGEIQLCAVAQRWLVRWGSEEDETTGDPGFYPLDGEAEVWIGPLAICPIDLVGVKPEDSITVHRGRRPGADPNAPDSCAMLEEIGYQKKLPQVSVSRLVVTKEEQERFGKAYLQKAPKADAEDSPLGARREQTLLRVIGALAKTIALTAGGKGKYFRGDKVNALAVAGKVGEVLSLADHRIAGMFSDPLRKTIRDGVDELEKALPPK